MTGKNYRQGFFRPLHPEKYKGDPENVIYRSSWEARTFAKLDADPDVMWWGSEETVVPYRSPLDKEVHRYFVDLTVCRKRPDGSAETMLIEIKPHAQTLEPMLSGKRRKRQLEEAATWLTNRSKWAAAERYCKKRGWTFKVLTEDTETGRFIPDY